MFDGDVYSQILAWHCAACTRLTLRFAEEPPPKACSWPTCRADALAPFPLRPSRRKD